MRIIPVIDIKNGQAVQARRGDRASYAPIHTPLSTDSAPLNVAAGLLGLAAFPTLYIADLDGIEGRSRNDATVEALAQRFPALDLWVDAGFATAAEASQWAARQRARPVVGSESLTRQAAGEPIDDAIILSLDFRGEQFQGPRVLLDTPSLWPRDVIVMTLARVGSGGGPDIERLRQILALAGPRRGIFAAGGTRDRADVAALADMGIAGDLVASALHDGRLAAGDLAAFLS